jgi:hypothetical protein
MSATASNETEPDATTNNANYCPVPVTTSPGSPIASAASQASGTVPDARLVHCVLLDGTFFRVVSVSAEGAVKAMCTACPDGKKPLSGTVSATTNFLQHLKVRILDRCNCKFT